MSNLYLTPRKVGFINNLYFFIKKENPNLIVEFNLYEDRLGAPGANENIEVHVTDGLKHVKRCISQETLYSVDDSNSFARRMIEIMEIKKIFGGFIGDK